MKAKAYMLIFWQLAVVTGLASIWLLQGIQSGSSALLGGIAYCLPNFIFVRRVFVNTHARAAKQFIISFSVGEALKLFSGAILFVFIVKYLPVLVLPALSGYIAAIIGFWVISMVFIAQEGKVGL